MHVEAVLGLAALCLVASVFYGPWQATCTDWARNFVFESRDKIFDLALSGELDFDSEEYQAIRNSLQSLIRYCHDLTLPKIVFHLVLGLDGQESVLQSAIDRISPSETRNKVARHVKRAQSAVLAFTAAKSIPGLFVIFIIWIVSKLPVNRSKYTGPIAERIQKDAEVCAAY
jgi:hypothetical protein